MAHRAIVATDPELQVELLLQLRCVLPLGENSGLVVRVQRVAPAIAVGFGLAQAVDSLPARIGVGASAGRIGGEYA